jgi:oxygen-dependent protoporphyrinogen oxidase
VICTSAWAAAELLRAVDTEAATVLARCQGLPLLTVTCFFDQSSSDINGFGCLFPRGQGFTALGVVCNDRVFKGRSDLRSETWILGGALHPELMERSDDEILAVILDDRRRLCGASARPREWRVTRHARALPHYTTGWERDLKELSVAPPLYLHGNYLGALGLARIYARSRDLARRIGEAHGGG